MIKDRLDRELESLFLSGSAFHLRPFIYECLRELESGILENLTVCQPLCETGDVSCVGLCVCVCVFPIEYLILPWICS